MCVYLWGMFGYAVVVFSEVAKDTYNGTSIVSSHCPCSSHIDILCLGISLGVVPDVTGTSSHLQRGWPVPWSHVSSCPCV